MKVVTRGGPFDGRVWRYPAPLPPSLMMFDPATHAYHEYVLTPHTTGYRYAGFVGTLPIPLDLDEAGSA